MKRILLIDTPITNSQAPEDFRLDYKREFLRLVEIVPDGVTASQMGTAIKLAQRLQDAQTGNHLLLEDAEWAYLKDKLTSAKFNFVAPEIVAMVEAVAQAQDVGSHLLGEERRKKATAE